MSSVKSKIDNLLKEKKVVVISKSYCPYCVKGKQALAQYQILPECIEIIEIENDPDCQEIQDYMMAMTGARTVPRVFIGGKCIGGGNETASMHKNGTLGKMLKEVGAIL